MSVGAIQTEADLAAFIQRQLARPGAIPAKPPIALTKEGVPTDEDFPNPPGNGIFALDKSTTTLYARVDGEWVAL